MVTSDLIFGFLLTKLLSPAETRSPAVVFPPSPGPTPPTPPPGPAPTPPALPAPSFPEQVSVPPVTTPAASVPSGFKRAIEVWVVQPSLARQAGAVLVGAPAEVVGAAQAISLQALEQQFPRGWQAAKTATPAEAQQAKALLAQWKDGGVVFMGPATLTGRRAFRMTRHPATATPATARPAPTASTPSAPGPTVPASTTTAPPPAAPAAPAPAPAQGPSTLPETLVTADAPKATPGASALQITTVRKGEGLANVAKRLGRPANQQSALELRAANVPGPAGDFSAQDLSKGGLKKAGRAGGLQPGDRLFVPQAWGPVDSARL